MGAKRRAKPDESSAQVVAPPATSLREEYASASRDLLAALDRFFVARVRLEGDAEGYYTQRNSPLGSRKHMALCRAGALEGAVKDGRLWLVKRKVVDAHLQAHGKTGAESNESMAAHLAGIRGKGRAA